MYVGLNILFVLTSMQLIQRVARLVLNEPATKFVLHNEPEINN